MPFLVPFIPALVAGGVAAAGTVGAAAFSANAAGKAQKSALNAQNTATQESLAAQKAALEKITQLQQPFINAGSTALPGIVSRINQGAPNFSSPNYARPMPGGTLPPQPAGGYMDRAIGVPEGSLGTTGKTGPSVDPASVGPAPGSPKYDPATSGQVPAASGPDWNAYLSANPDVAARAQQGVADGEIGPGSQWATPQDWAAFHYQNTGQAEGRAAPPMLAPSQGGPTAATQAPPQPLDLGTASPVVANYARPDQGTSPDAASFFDPSKFTTSPGYQFRLDQGLRDTNAKFGARGLLQSGAALQGFNDYAQNSASQEYNNWFNQTQQRYSDAANRYNTDLSNTNNNFNNDRSYGTNLAISNRDFANNQYNTQTQNMFQLAGIGANAAGAVGNAVSGNANNSSNLFTQQGNNIAQNALAQGQTQAGLAGSIGSTIGNLFGAQNYGSGPINMTAQNPGLIPQAVPQVPVGSLNTGISWTPY